MSQVPNKFFNKEVRNKINHTRYIFIEEGKKEKKKKKPIFPSSNKETKNETSK